MEVPDDGVIRVEDVLAGVGVDELNRNAEEYFARLDDWSEQLAKPMASDVEAPELLGAAAALLAVMDLAPGQRVLDFGAGTCWLSHLLAELGCAVVASDVSATALEIGRERFRRRPPARGVPEPELLVFDGHRLELDDASVDRVVCFDALHHVPNPDAVLAELHRVLAPGGRAGFAEPGPENSRTPQSQAEMRTFGVVERDVDVVEIRDRASRAGFADMRVGVYLARPRTMSVDDYLGFVGGKRRPARDALSALRDWHRDHTVFVLLKAGEEVADSRTRVGLLARLEVGLRREGGELRGHARIENTGSARWLPEPEPGESGAGEATRRGAVRLGAHLFDAEGALVDLDFLRVPLRGPGEAPVEPGETVEVDFTVPAEVPEGSVVEFDVVAEGVAWFATNGTEVVRHRVGGEEPRGDAHD